MNQSSNHLNSVDSDAGIIVDMSSLLSKDKSGIPQNTPVTVDLSEIVPMLHNSSGGNAAPSAGRIADPSTIDVGQYAPREVKPIWVILCVLLVIVLTCISPAPTILNSWAAEKISLVRTAELTRGISPFSLIILVLYFAIVCCISSVVKTWFAFFGLLVLSFVIACVSGLLGLLGFVLIVLGVMVGVLALVIGLLARL